MSAGLDNLRHIVVLMMENRSFDHMLGALKKEDPRINGLNGDETNPDSNNKPVKVQSKAQFRGQLQPDPDHHYPAVNKQLFNGAPSSGKPSMQGFVKSYFDQQHDDGHAQKIMYYYPPDKLPVLTTLARKYVLFNGWFSSIPGPTLCNRAFAHYGTSFGKVGMELTYEKVDFPSIYDRLIQNGNTAKIYYFDQVSSTLEVVNLLQNQPQIFGSYNDFLSDCENGALPDYCLVEPNYKDHEEGGEDLPANDQHPDHNVQDGEVFIATVYNAIRNNPDLWKSTALLVVYDEHGGIFDHVPPPACLPDGYTASGKETGIGEEFKFDRLGVRVPAILVSPWVQHTIVPGVDEPGGRIFEHACIPNTVTRHFLPDYDTPDPDAPNKLKRSPREAASETFLDLLSDTMRSEEDCPVFQGE